VELKNESLYKQQSEVLKYAINPDAQILNFQTLYTKPETLNLKHKKKKLKKKRIHKNENTISTLHMEVKTPVVLPTAD
jgi:hypothetical protein